MLKRNRLYVCAQPGRVLKMNQTEDWSQPETVDNMHTFLSACCIWLA